MMIGVSPQQTEAKAVSRDSGVSVHPPAPGSLIPATAVRVNVSGPTIEWLATTPTDAQLLDFGDAFLQDAITRCHEDVKRHPQSPSAQTNLAQAYWQANELEPAARHCQMALESDSENYVAQLLLARVREAQGRHQDAEALYSAVRTTRPLDSVALLGLANSHIRRGQFGEALTCLTDITRSEPDLVMPRFYLGMVLLRLHRINEAIAQFKHASATDVRSPVLHHALGLAYGAQGSARRAEAQFRAAIHLLPSYAPAVRSLGQLLISTRRSAAAIPMLESFLARSPQDDVLRDLLGWGFYENGEYRRALEQLKMTFDVMRSKRRDRDQLARVANNVGVNYSKLHEWKQASVWYDRAIEIDRSQAIPFHNLARTLLKLREFRRAEGVLHELQARAGRDGETSFLTAVAKHELGRSQEAVSELVELIASGAAPADAYSFVGSLLADEMESPAAAVRVLSEGLSRFPDSRLLANNVAYALLLEGKVGQARDALARYPEESTPDVCLRATWGLLHLREGDLDAGVAGYRQAESLAQAAGDKRLARQARQKMHLEVARFHLERGQAHEALFEIRKGLKIEGKPAYDRALRDLKANLPDV